MGQFIWHQVCWRQMEFTYLESAKGSYPMNWQGWLRGLSINLKVEGNERSLATAEPVGVKPGLGGKIDSPAEGHLL